MPRSQKSDKNRSNEKNKQKPIQLLPNSLAANIVYLNIFVAYICAHIYLLNIHIFNEPFKSYTQQMW